MSGRDKDATRAAKTNGRDPHRDIPKDANGDPGTSASAGITQPQGLKVNASGTRLFVAAPKA